MNSAGALQTMVPTELAGLVQELIDKLSERIKKK